MSQDQIGSSVIETDVCIVGAGFAGLSAALRLQARNVRCVILEARDRVGGRVWTDHHTAAKWLDRGGQWVGGDQKGFLELIELTRTPTYPTYTHGCARVRGVDADETLVTSHYPDRRDVPGIEKVKVQVDKLKAIVAQIPPEAPWNHPDAETLDNMTFREWLQKSGADARTQDFLEADISYACAAPQDISVLALLAIIRQCGGFEALNDDAQETRIVGGAQTVATRTVDLLLKPGSVYYNEPVGRINRGTNDVFVQGRSVAVHAKKVIVTAPPTVARDILFDPPLPALRQELMAAWPQGTVIKVGMIFATPFWRHHVPDRFNGLSLDYRALAVETADSSPTEDASPCGTLTAFVYTTKANEIKDLPAEERRTRILNDLKERFGGPVLNPLEYDETFWTLERFTKGCYGAYLKPGATTKFKNLIRDPVGPIHWAGSETSSVWPTFIEGAIQSGYRAAQEILDQKI